MFLEDNAAHLVLCDSQLHIVMAISAHFYILTCWAGCVSLLLTMHRKKRFTSFPSDVTNQTIPGQE
jgi:hypothetical protein